MPSQPYFVGETERKRRELNPDLSDDSDKSEDNDDSAKELSADGVEDDSPAVY